MRATLALLLAAAPLATPALAQDAAIPPQPMIDEFAQDSVTAGIAPVYLPDYEGSNNYRWVLAPGAVGTVKGYSFQLAGNRLSADVIPNAPGPVLDVQAGPLIVLNLNRRNVDNIESPRVQALGDLQTAVEVGGYVGLAKSGVITSPYDKIGVSLSYRDDVNGAHRSGILQPSVNYFTPLSRKAAAGVFVSAERVTGRYARYYFGVTPAQAQATGLAAYTPGGGWKNYTLGGLATYSISGDLLHGWKAVAGGTYQRLLGDFADSPLVSRLGSRHQWLGALGLAYTF